MYLGATALERLLQVVLLWELETERAQFLPATPLQVFNPLQLTPKALQHSVLLACCLHIQPS